MWNKLDALQIHFPCCVFCQDRASLRLHRLECPDLCFNLAIPLFMLCNWGSGFVLNMNSNCTQISFMIPVNCASVPSSTKWRLVISDIRLSFFFLVSFLFHAWVPGFLARTHLLVLGRQVCAAVVALFIDSLCLPFREYSWLGCAGIRHPCDWLPQPFRFHQHHFPL